MRRPPYQYQARHFELNSLSWAIRAIEVNWNLQLTPFVWSVWSVGSVWTNGTGEPAITTDGERMLLTGSADDIAANLAAINALGSNHVLFDFLSNSREGTCDRIEVFGIEMLARA